MANDVKEKEASSGNIWIGKRDFFTLAGWAVFLVTSLVYALKLMGPKKIGGFFVPTVLF